jgi:branched-chain amino acid transport system permease protein
VPLEEYSNSLLGGEGRGGTFVVYGAIIIAIARFQPAGVLPPLLRVVRGGGAAHPDQPAPRR